MTVRELEQQIGRQQRQIDAVATAAYRLERRAEFRSPGDDWRAMEAEAAQLRAEELPRLYRELHALEARRPQTVVQRALTIEALLCQIDLSPEPNHEWQYA